MDEILKVIRKRQKTYIIHPAVYENLTDWQKDFLDGLGKVFLCSHISPTKMYISKSDFSLNCPIDSWEEV